MELNHFLDLHILDPETLRSIIENAKQVKSGALSPSLKHPENHAPVLVMIFDKPSTRTRVSFDVAMRQLGGETIVLNSSDMQIGRGESIADTAQVLSRYGQVLMLRTSDHNQLSDLAAHADIPVINGLTNKSHPCQILADILTFEEKRGSIKGQTITWVGDGNNVANSWIHAASYFDFTLNLACPVELSPEPEFLEWAKQQAADVHVIPEPEKAAENADCIVTDVWVSMGQTDYEHRYNTLRHYQVNEDLMGCAKSDALFMHCLPAHRGDEVTAGVIDGPQSVVFDEAENRLHAQKAILLWCLRDFFK